MNWKLLNPKNIIRRYFFWKKTLEKLNGVLVFYNVPEEKRLIFNKLKEMQKEVRILMSMHGLYELFTIVRHLHKIPGDMAEVGVFQGGSARVIMEADPSKHIHLFDTFQGLPELTVYDQESAFHEGQYSVGLEEVKNNLKNHKNFTLYPGLFPKTANPVKDHKFSFVNLDVDLFQGTFDALEFFYPRLSRGGGILVHDYAKPGGVKKAVDDFFKDKPEAIFELTGIQGFIVKL
ncbi:MAG: TylF/MycF family methyltransferase [Candidatus Yanofskybacteria bacterium]|nr:TylF/MycF family methyltransferase [Candidatus Yanofskybacteria bacterium]